ncbi:hypothetical protein LUZ60_016827 [Juncus effusus]|nr:hypothetical protein LUZ60_016827 [Juncus effusus]
MASFKQISFGALSLFCLLHPCFSTSNSNRKLFNYDDPSNPTSWTSGGATWYGSPYGYGSDGGACGYQGAVGKFPLNSMIAAGSPSLFKSGKGCGVCYQVRCTSNSECSGNTVTVVITDQCPGGPCLEEPAHFDLSGTAFGALAKPFNGDQLRNAGKIKIEYRRVPCNYKGTKLSFRMDAGANPWYLAVLIEYENGDGDLSLVEVMQGGNSYSNSWTCMTQSWGALWMLNSGSPLQGPFSFRLTSGSGKILVATNVVPAGWQPGTTYTSDVNF